MAAHDCSSLLFIFTLRCLPKYPLTSSLLFLQVTFCCIFTTPSVSYSFWRVFPFAYLIYLILFSCPEGVQKICRKSMQTPPSFFRKFVFILKTNFCLYSMPEWTLTKISHKEMIQNPKKFLTALASLFPIQLRLESGSMSAISLNLLSRSMWFSVSSMKTSFSSLMLIL